MKCELICFTYMYVAMLFEAYCSALRLIIASKTYLEAVVISNSYSNIA